MEVVVTAPIQAVGLVYQAATAPVFSNTIEASETGGLLQITVPTLGHVNWSAASTMSSETAPVEASAFLLVASGIKN